MRGITKSSKTRSTFSCSKSSSASCPSCAGSAENALASKIEHTTLRIVGLSSTTRIRALISEWPSIVQGARPERQAPTALAASIAAYPAEAHVAAPGQSVRLEIFSQEDGRTEGPRGENFQDS